MLTTADKPYQYDEGMPPFGQLIIEQLDELLDGVQERGDNYGGYHLTTDGVAYVGFETTGENVYVYQYTANPDGGPRQWQSQQAYLVSMSPKMVAGHLAGMLNKHPRTTSDDLWRELRNACHSAGAGWVRAWGGSRAMLTMSADGMHNGDLYRLTVSCLRGDYDWHLSRNDVTVAGSHTAKPVRVAADAVQAGLLAYATDTATRKHRVPA